jgi:tRNA threonylcarbamoyladenosine modification (KEOPS) complex  Pcc1 subunit
MAPARGAPGGPTAEFSLDMGTPAVARVVLESIRPEAEGGPGSVAATLRQDGHTIHVRLAAPDEVELKATRSSLLRLAEAARRVAEIAAPGA